jgi:phage-related holin
MKNFIITFLTILISFLAPIKGLLLLMLAFVIIDTITGIYSSVKINGKGSFRSGKLFNIAPKLFIYLSAIMLAYGMDKLIVEDLFAIKLVMAKILTTIFIYTEIKSIDENSIKLGNRSIWTILKEIVTRAKYIKKDINL